MLLSITILNEDKKLYHQWSLPKTIHKTEKNSTTKQNFPGSYPAPMHLCAQTACLLRASLPVTQRHALPHECTTSVIRQVEKKRQPNEKDKSTQQRWDTTTILYAFATSVTVELNGNYIVQAYK